MELEGRDIVCVGFADWETELWTNQHHLLARLAQTNRVLFVESLGLRRPTLAARDVRRMGRRLRRGLGPTRLLDGVNVLSPLVLPFHGNRTARAVNAWLLPRLVARAARRLGFRSPVLWGYVPQAELLVDALQPSLVIYHCVDDISAHESIDSASFLAAERRFAARADLVFASSPPLVERLRPLAPGVRYMPNVADVALFASALEPGPIDAAIAALPSPRAVFTGAIAGAKVDFALLRDLARLRPDWAFALVGPVGLGDPHTDISIVAGEPNIHLLGSRRYSDLPAVLRGADAGLIPYAINKLTDSIFPMKVYEYLAAGLPVIATELPSIAGVEGIATVRNADEAAAALDSAFDGVKNGGGDDRRRGRSLLAAGHSWDARLDEIRAAVAAVSAA
jgi:glycosyltransferase involved in cell wall biosynthesis